MQKQLLGDTDLQTAPLIFGGNVFGWTLNKQQSFEMLDAWLDAGFNAIDTADVYARWGEGLGGGESETVLGEYFKTRRNRDQVMLTTKVGIEMGENRKGLSKAYILQAVEDSLRRLQTDYIDLYLSHTEDTQTPIEETLDAYHQLIEQGKVRYIGASNYSPEGLAQALQVADQSRLPRYQVLQPFYNLYDRDDFETRLAALCQREKLAVTPYFSLASGFLTGKYRRREDAQGQAREQFVKNYFTDRGMRVLAALDQVAEAYQVAPASVALAWLMAQPVVTAPIVSARSSEQFKALVDAANLTLDESALATLTEASMVS